MKVLIIDFDDSFTYNIFSELFKRGVESEVISYQEILKNQNRLTPYQRIILGPGPGHPRDYQSFQRPLKKILQTPEVFTLGICLGHQLLWSFYGGEVRASQKPLHGQSVSWTIPSWDYFSPQILGKKVAVQRYNSLSCRGKIKAQEVKNIALHEGEVFAVQYHRAISFQFHPESLGTNYPEFYFNPFLL